MDRILADSDIIGKRLVFKNPVEIIGNIYAGTRILSLSDLYIYGDVIDSQISCKGNLKISGIVSGENSLIRGRKDVYINALSGARVEAKGDIFFEGRVYKGSVYALGAILFNKEFGVLEDSYIESSFFIELCNVSKGSKIFIVSKAQLDWYNRYSILEDEINKLKEKIRSLFLKKRFLSSESQKVEIEQKIIDLEARIKELEGEIFSLKREAYIYRDRIHRVFIYCTAKKGALFNILGKEIVLEKDLSSSVLYVEGRVYIKPI